MNTTANPGPHPEPAEPLRPRPHDDRSPLLPSRCAGHGCPCQHHRGRPRRPHGHISRARRARGPMSRAAPNLTPRGHVDPAGGRRAPAATNTCDVRQRPITTAIRTTCRPCRPNTAPPVSLIAASALLSLSALCGWSVGLTWHARRTAGWRDPGARLAWTTAVGLLIVICGPSLLLLAISTAILWLPGVLLVAAASACGAWWACQHTAAPDAGERRDRRSGLRWEIPALTRLAAAHRRYARQLSTRITRLGPPGRSASGPRNTAPDGDGGAEGEHRSRRRRDRAGRALSRLTGQRIPAGTKDLPPIRKPQGGNPATQSDDTHHGDANSQPPAPRR